MTIWVARHGGDLYVRSWRGSVAAYRTKYRRYAASTIDHIVNAEV